MALLARTLATSFRKVSVAALFGEFERNSWLAASSTSPNPWWAPFPAFEAASVAFLVNPATDDAAK
jgi:hypothetical protein